MRIEKGGRMEKGERGRANKRSARKKIGRWIQRWTERERETRDRVTVCVHACVCVCLYNCACACVSVCVLSCVELPSGHLRSSNVRRVSTASDAPSPVAPRAPTPLPLPLRVCGLVCVLLCTGMETESRHIPRGCCRPSCHNPLCVATLPPSSHASRVRGAPPPLPPNPLPHIQRRPAKSRPPASTTSPPTPTPTPTHPPTHPPSVA